MKQNQIYGCYGKYLRWVLNSHRVGRFRKLAGNDFKTDGKKIQVYFKVLAQTNKNSLNSNDTVT